MSWCAAFGAGAVIAWSDKLLESVYSKGEGSGGGSSSTGHPGPRTPKTSLESRPCFIFPQSQH